MALAGVFPKQVIAGYEIGGVIGIGTYGEVRVAKQLSTGLRVAVKLVDISRFDRDASSVMLKEVIPRCNIILVDNFQSSVSLQQIVII